MKKRPVAFLITLLLSTSPLFANEPIEAPKSEEITQEEVKEKTPESGKNEALEKSTPKEKEAPKESETSEKKKDEEKSQKKRKSKIELESKAERAPLPINELRLFTEVLEQLKRDYVEPLDDKTLIQNAIKGMLSELDPHSGYYTKEEYSSMLEVTQGSFVGLGVEVIPENGLIRVITPIDDTPAYEAGIKAGDLIIKIDDTPVQSVDVNRAIEMLRGEEGSEVTITLIRSQESTPLTLTITRANIQTKSVKSELLNEEYGYIRLSQFQEESSEEVRNAISKLQRALAKEKRLLKGLVLDLRNNPGGLLTEGVALSDLFIDGGLITYTQGQSEESRLDFNAEAGDLLNGAPLVVLINSGSASASEIVAGALQDHKRALIVGERSFGKGSVQTVLDLEGGKGLKYTSGRYYTPNGRSIQGLGIEPDVPFAPIESLTLRSDHFDFREADIKGHLSESESDEKKRDFSEENHKLATEDYPLFEALTLLKLLATMQSNH